MDREKLQQLWADMAKEGNWVPSWTDSLEGLTPEEAAWSPGEGCHCIWQEVRHVTFWRKATLAQMDGGTSPTEEQIEREQFAMPEVRDTAAWETELADFTAVFDQIASKIADPETDLSRITYHILHDAYHLGRITQLRGMRGTAPKF